MAYPPESAPPDLRVRPSAWWYLIVALLGAAGIFLAVSVIVTGVRLVDDGVSRVPSSAQVDVRSDGLTVYAAYRPSSVDCTITGQGHVVQLHSLGYDLNATIDGTRVYAIASTRGSVDSGVYRVSCSGVSPPVQLWTGDRIPIASLVIRSVAAAGCLVVGLVILIVVLIRRSLSKTRIKSRQLLGARSDRGWPRQSWPGGP